MHKRSRSGTPIPQTQAYPHSLMMQVDPPERKSLLETHNVQHKYVSFGKPLARKFHELNQKYVKYEYVLAGDSSAIAPSAASHAWGELKTHSLAAGAGAYSVTTQGAVPFVNQTNSVGGATRLPGFLFSLTRCPNIVDDAGTVQQRAQIMVPYMRDSTQGFRWANAASTVAGGPRDLYGIYADTSYGTNWERCGVQDTGGSAGNVPLRYGMLKRSNIKLELWGQRLRTTKWRILICQFDEDCAPTLAADSTDPVDRDVTWSASSAGAKFWVNEFKRYAHHPWAATYTNSSTSMKVLFSDVVWIDARSTMDESTTPQCVTKNYTFDFNRSCRFDWDVPTTNVTESDVNTFNRQVFAGNYRADVDPKARIYLYVVAENFKGEAPTIGSTSTNSYIPSMSMKVTNTWCQPTR